MFLPCLGTVAAHFLRWACSFPSWLYQSNWLPSCLLSHEQHNFVQPVSQYFKVTRRDFFPSYARTPCSRHKQLSHAWCKRISVITKQAFTQIRVPRSVCLWVNINIFDTLEWVTSRFNLFQAMTSATVFCMGTHNGIFHCWGQLMKHIQYMYIQSWYVNAFLVFPSALWSRLVIISWKSAPTCRLNFLALCLWRVTWRPISF